MSISLNARLIAIQSRAFEYLPVPAGRSARQTFIEIFQKLSVTFRPQHFPRRCVEYRKKFNNSLHGYINSNKLDAE